MICLRWLQSACCQEKEEKNKEKEKEKQQKAAEKTERGTEAEIEEGVRNKGGDT